MKKGELRAILYADIFDYPLKKEEMVFWAIKGKEGRVKKRVFEKRSNYYFLKGRDKIIKLREKRKKESKKKFSRAMKMAKVIQLIPTVRLVGISGNLAIENCERDDDIDFFVGTRKGSVWRTRFLINLMFDFLNWRRKPGEKNFKDKACFNFFLDEDNYGFSEEERNLFLAHEVLQMEPIFSKGDSYANFLKSNYWVKDFLPAAYEKRKKEAETIRAGDKEKERYFLKTGEEFLMKLQAWWMKKRKTKEKIGKGVIKLHPKDKSLWVLKEYRRREVFYCNLC